MQARIFPGRGSGGRSRTVSSGSALPSAASRVSAGLQPVEIVDDALHGELRRVGELHRIGDADHAALGEQAWQDVVFAGGLKQCELHWISLPRIIPISYPGLNEGPSKSISR